MIVRSENAEYLCHNVNGTYVDVSDPSTEFVDVYKRQALGHSSIKVTETYLKPFENEKVDAANDELIMSVVKRSKEKIVA